MTKLESINQELLKACNTCLNNLEYGHEIVLRPDQVEQLEQAIKHANKKLTTKESIIESNCHGIEMIISPSGKEWAIGGTNTEDRFKFNPWSGEPIK